MNDILAPIFVVFAAESFGYDYIGLENNYLTVEN